ncbi:MAG: hypothetical protein ACKN9U_20975, partial [Pirellulaceae bacterium]
MNRFQTPGDVASKLRLLAFGCCLFLLPLGMQLAMSQEESQAAETQVATSDEAKALGDPSASLNSEQATGPQV